MGSGRERVTGNAKVSQKCPRHGFRTFLNRALLTGEHGPYICRSVSGMEPAGDASYCFYLTPSTPEWLPV